MRIGCGLIPAPRHCPTGFFGGSALHHWRLDRPQAIQRRLTFHASDLLNWQDLGRLCPQRHHLCEDSDWAVGRGMQSMLQGRISLKSALPPLVCALETLGAVAGCSLIEPLFRS